MLTIEPFVFNTQYSRRSLLNTLPVVYCDIVKLVHEHVIVLSIVISGSTEFTDLFILERTCGGGGQVITIWSHSRPSEYGKISIVLLVNEIKTFVCADYRTFYTIQP